MTLLDDFDFGCINGSDWRTCIDGFDDNVCGGGNGGIFILWSVEIELIESVSIECMDDLCKFVVVSLISSTDVMVARGEWDDDEWVECECGCWNGCDCEYEFFFCDVLNDP